MFEKSEIYNDTVAMVVAFYQVTTNPELIVRMMDLHEVFIAYLGDNDDAGIEALAFQIEQFYTDHSPRIHQSTTKGN